MCPFKAVNKQKANKVKIRFTDCGFFVGVGRILKYILKQIQTSSNRLSCRRKLTSRGLFEIWNYICFLSYLMLEGEDIRQNVNYEPIMRRV